MCKKNICSRCDTAKIDAEIHFVNNCSAVTADGADLFWPTKISIHNFAAMDTNVKFTAIISSREPFLVKELSGYMYRSFERAEF